ncbi:MAG: 1-(5-phosphoribosyl)-5-((5-phosphoribosylamino)methylideneamino)imidazole-4-carboxamide isomerase [Thermoleophilia bacterium]|nr:1-(5-phosphoribosyl)-5-((5-phosphoribosylamino)methylideneamino)imidazole-4-carboxamide isomerase [Thermoleophilia bacterium]
MIVVPQVAFHATEVAMGEELPPVRIVRELVAAGAREVALLDLDGTLASDVLPQWTEAIVAVAGTPLRFDGRLHEGSRIERIARAGFAAVVVDQTAVFDPLVLRWALDMFGDRLLVEVQVDGDYVFDAPPAAFGRELVDVLGDLHFQGVRRLLYRDVTGTEVQLGRLLQLSDRLPGMRFTYHGAVRGLGDVEELAALGHLIDAVHVDSRLVDDGSVDLVAANRIAAAVPD